eukprot:TRINITY_DN1243_c0_g1_i2.p1 TRINITY_DN1243_c0_g1~~TRINITY_DN1243_c0_g1_i2.p1  ORF type:complete len:308 (-),score=81.49 TRINITY_DN1243_c0_g1_i2:64-987(-)
MYTATYVTKSKVEPAAVQPASDPSPTNAHEWHIDETADSEADATPALASPPEKQIGMDTFVQQLFSHHNLHLWMAVSTIQVFNCHFNSNFFSLFTKFFFGNNGSPLLQSTMVYLSTVGPHLLVVACTPLLYRYGLHSLLNMLFVVKVVLSSCALMLNFVTDAAFVVPLYLMLGKVFNEVVCRHGNLAVSDLTDEDYVRNARHLSVSAMMVGIVNFVTKPGQSAAPMLTWALLPAHVTDDVIDEADAADRQTLAACVVATPLVCGLLQLLLWRRFTLRGPVLAAVKRRRADLDECDAARTRGGADITV